MNPNNWGRLARIFESRGFMDKPEAGSVTIAPVMWGLGLYTAAGNQSTEVDALAGEITPEEASNLEPLTPAEEAAFWEGYRTQAPHKRRGRPRGERQPRTVMMSEQDVRTLRIAGNGNISEGIARLVAEYTRLPEVD